MTVSDVVLTATEQKIFDGIMRGLTNRQIGDEMELAEKTIKDHCTRIYKKFGVSTRVALLIKMHNDTVIVANVVRKMRNMS